MTSHSIKKKHAKGILHRAIVASVELTRYAIKGGVPDKNKAVMSTHGEVAFFDKGVSNWKLDLAKDNPMSETSYDTPHAVVDAQWLTAHQALESDIEVVHGGNANTFGGMGALLVPDDFSIPTVTATKENVKHYGLQLIENKENFSVTSDQVQIVMMRYDYTEDYKEQFLLQESGGGGIFVETHNFPHIHVPLSESCGGYIVIGKQVSSRAYHFTAFRIPYGYALYTPSNTIHGDGTLVGEYALTVANSALIQADTVLMYSSKTFDMARNIVPDWRP